MEPLGTFPLTELSNVWQNLQNCVQKVYKHNGYGDIASNRCRGVRC